MNKLGMMAKPNDNLMTREAQMTPAGLT